MNRMPLEATETPAGALESDLGSQVAQELENVPTSFSADLKNDYLKTRDPTEYRFVKLYIPGGWKEWQRILHDPIHGPVIGFWRDELAAKLRSESLMRILEAAQGETRDALSANKYLYEMLSPKEKVGRPSNEKILKEAERLREDERIVEEAYERIFNAKEKESQEG